MKLYSAQKLRAFFRLDRWSKWYASQTSSSKNHISGLPYVETSTRDPNKMQNLAHDPLCLPLYTVPFGVTYEKIGTIQRRLAWPLHKDDTLSRSGRSTDLNIYFLCFSSQYKWFKKVHFVCSHNSTCLIQGMPGIWFMFTKHPDEKQDGT